MSHLSTQKASLTDGPADPRGKSKLQSSMQTQIGSTWQTAAGLRVLDCSPGARRSKDAAASFSQSPHYCQCNSWDSASRRMHMRTPNFQTTAHGMDMSAYILQDWAHQAAWCQQIQLRPKIAINLCTVHGATAPFFEDSLGSRRHMKRATKTWTQSAEHLIDYELRPRQRTAPPGPHHLLNQSWLPSRKHPRLNMKVFMMLQSVGQRWHIRREEEQQH